MSRGTTFIPVKKTGTFIDSAPCNRGKLLQSKISRPGVSAIILWLRRKPGSHLCKSRLIGPNPLTSSGQAQNQQRTRVKGFVIFNDYLFYHTKNPCQHSCRTCLPAGRQVINYLFDSLCNVCFLQVEQNFFSSSFFSAVFLDFFVK